MHKAVKMGACVSFLALLLGCPLFEGDAGGDDPGNALLLPTDVGFSVKMDRIALLYYGEFSPGVYNTDIEFLSPGWPDIELLFTDQAGGVSVSNVSYAYAWLYDDSPGIELSPGTYTFAPEGVEQAFRFEDISVGAGGAGVLYDDLNYGYEAEHVDDFNPDFDDDSVTDGTITVSVNGSEYTFVFDLMLADGGTITGTFRGAVDYRVDQMAD